jgi:Lrp/AsnC family transcriptional regulator for asnA, asnC and gidA
VINLALVYVLVSVERGRLEDIRRELVRLPRVSEVNYVTGKYDIVAKLKGEELEELLKIVHVNIQKLRGLKKTETLVSMI